MRSIPGQVHCLTAAIRITSSFGTRHVARPERLSAGIAPDVDAALDGHYQLRDGTRVALRCSCCVNSRRGTPDWAEHITVFRRSVFGSSHVNSASRRLSTASSCRCLADAWGVSMQRHRRAGRISCNARSCSTLERIPDGRALAVLMSLLGTIDAPGGFRHKAPIRVISFLTIARFARPIR